MVVALLTRAISCILIQYVRRRTRWQYLEQTVGLISTLKLLEYRVWLFLRGSAVVTDTDKQKYLSCVLSYSFMLNLGGNFFSLHVYLMLCKTACFYFFASVHLNSAILALICSADFLEPSLVLSTAACL